MKAKLNKEVEEIASLPYFLQSRQCVNEITKNKVHDLKEATTKLKDHSLNDAKVAENLRSLVVLLPTAQKCLEDQDPYAKNLV